MSLVTLSAMVIGAGPITKTGIAKEKWNDNKSGMIIKDCMIIKSARQWRVMTVS